MKKIMFLYWAAGYHWLCPPLIALEPLAVGTEVRREMHEHPSPLPQRSNRLKHFKQNPNSSSVMLLSQQIHFLQRRRREQSYIHLQPNLSLVITSALARPDILPAKNIIRTTTQRILLLNSLFSASCTGKAFCKQHVGALTELNTNNPKFPLTPILRLKFWRASCLTQMLARQFFHFPPSSEPLCCSVPVCSQRALQSHQCYQLPAKGINQCCPSPNLNSHPQEQSLELSWLIF